MLQILILKDTNSQDQTTCCICRCLLSESSYSIIKECPFVMMLNSSNLKELIRKWRKQIHTSGNTTLFIPTKDFSNIFSILKTFENSGVLLVGTADTISSKIEEQIIRFFGTLVVGLLPNLL